MGKYFISFPWIAKNGSMVIGRIALKWKKDEKWKVICYKGKREICAGEITANSFPSDVERLLKIAYEKLKRIYPNCYIQYSPLRGRCLHELPEKGFKLLDLDEAGLWVRRSRKRRVFTICLCFGWKILRRLKYLRHRDVIELKALADSGDRRRIIEVLENLGINIPSLTKSQKEREQDIVEGEGWGTLAQEYLENGSFEEELYEAMLDGDVERARWLLNSPEDAREMGVDEEIIKWAFGEEDEENE